MKETQASKNPYKNSDTNKRYYTYDYYLRKTFGGKCAKISIDGGFTCPNIDGRCAYGGCIYCSPRGSGDFTPSSSLDIKAQFEEGLRLVSAKWDTPRRIVYFQAHTNTYAPADVLRQKFYSALELPGVVGLNIATRADCLPQDVTELLCELAERTVLTVELGLQTTNDETGKLINRGHTFEDFCKGFYDLRRASKKINIGAHLIFGLPTENHEIRMQSVRDLASLEPDQVKLHLLYVAEGTRLAQMYKDGLYIPMEREEYIECVCDALERLPYDAVVGRLTGDGDAKTLLAPLWSRRKTAIINDIDKELFRRDSYQGRLFVK